MMVPMKKCKTRLALVWLIGFAILFFVVVLQTILGRFGDRANDAWAWLLPTILPTLSLITGVLVSDSINKREEAAYVDTFMYRMALGLSSLYLIVVSLTIFLQPFSQLSILDLMKQSHLWLGPFQGIVTAAVGVFFVGKGPQATPTRPND